MEEEHEAERLEGKHFSENLVEELQEDLHEVLKVLHTIRTQHTLAVFGGAFLGGIFGSVITYFAISLTTLL